MENTFITPEGHKGFLAKKLFNEMGKIQWGAIAYISENGGGPENNHTHSDNHIFIVADRHRRQGDHRRKGSVGLCGRHDAPLHLEQRRENSGGHQDLHRTGGRGDLTHKPPLFIPRVEA